MTSRRIRELIEASSLGTPAAKAARESVDPAFAAEIVRRSQAMGHEHDRLPRPKQVETSYAVRDGYAEVDLHFEAVLIERDETYLPLIVQRLQRRTDPVAYLKSRGEDGGLFDLLDGGAA